MEIPFEFAGPLRVETLKRSFFDTNDLQMHIFYVNC